VLWDYWREIEKISIAIFIDRIVEDLKNYPLQHNSPGLIMYYKRNLEVLQLFLYLNILKIVSAAQSGGNFTDADYNALKKVSPPIS